jgi:hypothetical protein
MLEAVKSFTTEAQRTGSQLLNEAGFGALSLL